MVELPIDRVIPEVVRKVREARALVLVAEPGAGKTTRVPPAILKAGGLLSDEHPNVVMLQPRRVAARASAQRIAEENGWELGREVGYQIRFEKRMTDRTRLRVMTEGILTRQLLDDPFLTGVGAVILDEFHERSLHTDVAAALLREIKRSVREDLVLIVMSATLESEPVARFLDGCPVIRAEGRTFPVEVEYAGTPAGAAKVPLWERAADEVRRVVTSAAEGDVLVFLPGVEEIRRTMALLEGLAEREDLSVLPLHGSLTGEEQVAALRPAAGGRRKVICATNIAETSLTINGVRTVIDGGMARVAAYDSRRGLDRLELQRISNASATQRAGRAGRTAPGRCVRLWSERENALMDDFELPEIRRVDLASTVLALHSWGEDPRKFAWYESPAKETLAAAERLLEMLGALTSERDGKITDLGRKMLSLPVHPRLARLMVEGAERGMLDDAAGVAAVLSEKDFVVYDRSGAKERGRSDVLKRLELLDNKGKWGFGEVDSQGLRQVSRVKAELLRVGRWLKTRTTARGGRGEDDLLKLVLSAYPDRVCRRRASDRETAAMAGGGGVRLGRETVVQDAEYFVAVDARHDERSREREAIVRIASAIEPGWLEELFPQEVRREKGAVFDPERQRVAGVSGVYYRDLVLREDRDVAVDAATAGHVLAEALRPRAREIFTSDEKAAALLARVSLLRQHMTEQAWPAFDDAELTDLLGEACAGRRSVEDVRRGPLVESLRSRLPYPLDRLLDQHAPESIEVPTGNRIRIDYSGPAPVLAVRLQELFGWTDTPRVAGGRVPLVIHLLGPNYRPVQITSDLRSFWSGTYFQVRKDLRAQYPKHSWPEDPLTAKPEAKGGRRRSP